MEKHCTIMDSVANSLPLRCIIIINVGCSLLAIPLNLTVLRATYKHNLVHYNMKWILIFHLCCLIAHNISRITMHTIDLTHYMSLRDSGCDIIPSQIRCFALRLPMTVTMYLAYSSTFMASIERYIATTRLATYESNRIAGHFLIGGQVLFCALLHTSIYYNFSFSGRILHYCLATVSESPLFSIVPMGICVGIQIIAIVIFKILIRVNKEMKESLLDRRSDLVSICIMARLYQVRENLRSMLALDQFLITSCLFSTVCIFIRGIVLYINSSLSEPVYFALIEGSNLLPLYSLLLPAILWYSYRKVSKEAEAKHKRTLDRNALENTQLYFNELQYSWNQRKN